MHILITTCFIFFNITLYVFSAVFVFVVFTDIVAKFTTDAPFVPIPDNINNDIIKNLQLTDESVLYDLGCGDARILKKATETKPKIHAVGIEIALTPYLLAKYKTRKYKQIKIKRENIFQTDISEATHIFLYLYPEVVNRLIDNIKNQCIPGTRIVSCDFEIVSLMPAGIINLDNKKSKRGQKLFIYIL